MAGLLQAVDCLRLRVPDLDAGLAFYVDKLGHALVWRTETAAGLQLADAKTELVLYTAGPPELLDLKVHSADEAAQAMAAAGGAVMVEPFDIPIGRCTVVRDPWGNELVLLDSSNGQPLTDGHPTEAPTPLAFDYARWFRPT